MFLISVLAVLFSAYFLTSCLMKNEEKNHLVFIYFFLISFAQIVLIFELLSLFSLINPINFLIGNFIVLIFAVLTWVKNKMPVYNFPIKSIFKKLIEVLKKDKALFFLAIFFSLFLAMQLLLALFLPCNFGDAMSYYFPRCTTWLQQGNLNHFTTLDARELVMPINMDLLYLWKIMFTKNIGGVGIFSYLGFVLAVTSLFNFSRELGFSVRRSLWSIFIFSSLALVGLEIHTPILDLFVGSLLISAIYLFLLVCKNNSRHNLYFSSLTIALALGTKTTAIIVLPVILCLFVVISFVYSKENAKTNIIKLVLFLIFNFFIFSSYNYFQNFIDFNNFVSSKEQILLHGFNGGIKSFLCSFTKYIFMFFDFSGMPDFVGYNNLINRLQIFVLSLFGEKLDSYTSNYFLKYFIFNSKVTLISSLLGIFGLVAFLPSFLISIKKYFQNKKSKKRTILFALSLALVLMLLILAISVVYMGYNARFILTFVVIASPILLYTYMRKVKLIKCAFVLVAFIYLFCIPAEIILENKTIEKIKTEEAKIYDFLIRKKPLKVAIMIEQGNIPLYEIEKLKLNGVILDKLLPEKIEKYDLSQYEYIITNKYDVTSTIIVGDYNETHSSCTYWDREAKMLGKYDETEAVIVLCKIPHAYFYKNNFVEVENIFSKSYIIWRKKVT